MITSGTPFSPEPRTALADLDTQTNNQHLEIASSAVDPG